MVDLISLADLHSLGLNKKFVRVSNENRQLVLLSYQREKNSGFNFLRFDRESSSR